MAADLWDSSLYDDRHSFVWKAGSDLLDLLDPQKGERVLDIGCGTGHLTAQIAERGAEVIGLDSSLSMVAQARQNFPKLKFQLADVRDFHVDQPFDAVFSNAALHWVREAEAAIECMARALKPGGRLVLEMGGRGNIACLASGTEAVLREAGYRPRHTWYFPAIGEYATLLEKHGFEVRLAQNFARPTQLEHPERGLREWLEMFGGAWFKDVPKEQRADLERAIEDRLRPELWRDGSWFADYRRLRVVAEKP
ncbi:MAG: methyltransferase domain-containing protein [Acidobacteriota bacterium]